MLESLHRYTYRWDWCNCKLKIYYQYGNGKDINIGDYIVIENGDWIASNNTMQSIGKVVAKSDYIAYVDSSAK